MKHLKHSEAWEVNSDEGDRNVRAKSFGALWLWQ